MRALPALLLLAACSASAWANEAGPTFGGPYRFTEQGGEAIYRWVCAGCHMPDGHGAAGAGLYPSIAADSRLAAAAYPIGVVLHGQKAMPPFARSLTDAQVADVVAYIRTHFGNDDAGPVTPAEVAAAR